MDTQATNGAVKGLANGHRPTMEQKRLCKLDFIHGKGTVRGIAEKYGVKPKTALQWSANEDWNGLRLAWHRQQDGKILGPEPEPEKEQEKPQAGDWAGVVKAQIESIDEQLKTCTEPLTMTRLADAKVKLAGLIYPKPGRGRRRDSTPGQHNPGPVRLNPVPVPALSSTLQDSQAQPGPVPDTTTEPGV